jgi:hypothetical protein
VLLQNYIFFVVAVVSCVVTDATERNFNAVLDSSSEFFYIHKKVPFSLRIFFCEVKKFYIMQGSLGILEDDFCECIYAVSYLQ